LPDLTSFNDFGLIQTLDYLTPMEYIINHNENVNKKVLPMCLARFDISVGYSLQAR